MKILILLYLIGVVVPLNCHTILKRQTTTPQNTTSNQETSSNIEASESSSDSTIEQCFDDDDYIEDVTSERAMMAGQYFPETMSRERTLAMLKRAIALIEKPKQSSQAKKCRSDASIDLDAKNTIRFLTGDPTIGSTTDETSQDTCTTQEDDYLPEALVIQECNRRVSGSSARNIYRLHMLNKTEKTISRQYPWYRRQYLRRIRAFVMFNGTRHNEYEEIDRVVQMNITDALDRGIAIHDHHLREWGYERADLIGFRKFRASNQWLTNIKKRGNVVGRKCTDYKTTKDIRDEEKIQQSKRDFIENYRYVSQFFPHHMIINVDQSANKYEASDLRSLARRGVRDHVLLLDSANKNTHSYTVQPMISRDGTLRGKVLICFREPSDSFGPNVERRVRQLEEELGNVVAFASGSGKMSKDLTRRWVDGIFMAEVHRLAADEDQDETISTQDSQATEIAGPSWASNELDSLTEEQRRILEIRNLTRFVAGRPLALLLVDSWGGHSSNEMAVEMNSRGIFTLQIPPRTTADLQPLDVQVFRQWKIMVKRIREAATFNGILRNVTERYGIMRMHSLIFNQFQAPRYRDMFRWAWRHTDPFFDQDEMDNSAPPMMSLKIQFDFNRSQTCGVDGCHNKPFIRCAHCGKLLCLQHFFQRECFHLNNETQLDDGNWTSTISPPYYQDDDSSGSGGGALLGVSAMGAGVAAAGTIAANSAVAAGGVSSIVSGASPGSSSTDLDHIEMIPLIKKNVPDRVEVFYPAVQLKDLILD